GNPDFRLNIAVAVSHVLPKDGNLTRSSTVVLVDQVDMPQLLTRLGIGVKRIQAIVLSRCKNNVVHRTVHRQGRHPQWFSVNRAIHRAGKQQTERCRVHRAWAERELVGIDAVASRTVVIGENARQVGSPDGRRRALGIVSDAGCFYGVGAGGCRWSVEASGRNGSNGSATVGNTVY